MQKETMSVVVSIVAALAAVVLFSTLARAFFYASDDTELPTPESESLYSGGGVAQEEMPVYLSIPALGIEADVIPVGITEAGNMAAPARFSDVGWYKYGPTPGELGSAVLAGHVDNGLGFDGVFGRLDEIKPGDVLQVQTENGKSLRFTVDEVGVYPYDQVPVAALFNQNDAARLNLVTCAGTWVSAERTYDERLVVFALLENS